MRILKHIYQEEAPSDTNISAPTPGSEGAAATPAPAEETSLFAAVKDTPAPTTQEPTTQTPEQQALKNAQNDTRRPAHVPAKFWDHEKGEIKTEDAFKAYTALESRMRDTGLPPQSADEYKYEPPETFKELGVDLDPVETKAFKEFALSQGLSQKQYENIVNYHFSRVGKTQESAEKYGQEKLRKELTEFYKTPEETDKNVKLAYKVIESFADQDELAAISSGYGNVHPAFYRVLAKIGNELGEDHGLGTPDLLPATDIETLQKSPAYWDPKDPQHSAVFTKVKRHYEQQELANKRKR